MYEIVVIGTSWGGLNALTRVVSGLSRGFPLPIVIVQHRSKDSDDSLTTLLSQATTLAVVEAEDKEDIVSGRIYIAPPDYHLLVERGVFSLSTEAPVAYSRPSIDVTFESAADSYTSGVIGVIMTGANADGSKGLKRIKRRGGYAIVQDPNEAESKPMPEAAIAAVTVDRVLTLDEIPRCLIGLCDGAARHL